MTQLFEVADLFCGAGGSSTGAQRAIRKLGGELRLRAVNHWPRAIATHKRNHPLAEHYVQDVNDADPEQIVPDGRLDLLMASPECRFFSRARGGKPIKPQGRMSPWAINRWLSALDVRCLIVENVPEFVDWSPVVQNSHGDWLPDPSRRGLYFQAWVKSLWEMGYAFEWRYLNAADFGDATTRIRFFGIGRKDGLPIRWPEPTHARTGSSGSMFGTAAPWRAAREILDLTDTGGSIFARRRKLSAKTLHRIARGVVRFSGRDGRPCLERMGRELDFDAGPYLEQATGPGRGGTFILGQHGGSVARSVDEPVPTITTGGFVTKVHPFLTSYYSTGSGTSSLDQPLATVTTKDRHALVVPYGPRAEARPVTEPLQTIMTRDRLALCTPFVVPNFGEAPGQQPRVHSVDEPLPSVTSHGAGAVVSPTPTEGDVHYRMLKHRELARAMGFDDDEQQYEFTGTSTEITKQIGNAVAVNLAAALVTAVLGSVVQTEHGTKEVA